VVVPLLHPEPVLLRPLDVGHPERLVVGVCCLEDCERDWPQRFWPISVKLLALELVGSPRVPQESLALLLVPDSFDELVLKLQVEEVNPRLFSTVFDGPPSVLSELC